jgi:hypothetical protein
MITFPKAGDGPKIIELEQMREKYQSLVHSKLELLGSVRHEKVRDASLLSISTSRSLNNVDRSLFKHTYLFTLP